MNEDLKNRFREEMVTIKGYIDYIENNFYNRSCQVLRTQGFEEFEALRDYVFLLKMKLKKRRIKKYLLILGK